MDQTDEEENRGSRERGVSSVSMGKFYLKSRIQRKRILRGYVVVTLLSVPGMSPECPAYWTSGSVETEIAEDERGVSDTKSGVRRNDGEIACSVQRKEQYHEHTS